MAAGILYEGSTRLISPEEVKTTPMLVIAVLEADCQPAGGGKGVARALTQNGLSVKSAFLHVLGEAADTNSTHNRN